MNLIFGAWQYNDHYSVDLSLQKMYTGLRKLPHQIPIFKATLEAGFGCLISKGAFSNRQNDQPVYLHENQLLFVSQGRIDNIGQLTKKLDCETDIPHSSALVILQAYRKWGKNCMSHLRGEWSFAAFDPKTQELFIAQSPTGYTALYYYQDHTGFYFSSSIKAILELPSYSKQLNEGHFIHQLTLWGRENGAYETFYHDIFSLPPAHFIVVKGRKVLIEKYWQPQITEKRIYQNKQKYADEMLELFIAAIKSRLSDNKSIASTLSGGLDSSAVSYTAAELLKLENISLTTFSHVPLFRSEILEDIEKEKSVLDETPFIESIVNASGNMESVLLNSARYSVLDGMIDFLDIYSAPAHGACNAYWLLDIYRTAAQKGIEVLLKGEGGNGSISFAGAYHLLPPSISCFIHNPSSFIKSRLAKPLFQTFFPGYFNKRSHARNSLKRYAFNVFARPYILEQHGITMELSTPDKIIKPPLRNIQQSKELFLSLYNVRSAIGAASGQYYGIELRDPTIDQDLIEYFFSIPNEAFFDTQFNNRMLVKRMMRGKIPDKVLFEKRKGLQSADIVYRVKAQASEISSAIENIKNSTSASYYIDIQSLNDTWQIYLKQPYVEPYQMQNLLKALQFALFLHKNFD